MIYEGWGFTGSPFQTTPLPATATGEKLLVGRDDELRRLKIKIASPPNYATLEGLNGVGKTSIVNVACYQLFQQHLHTGKGPLYIPCRKIFQLNPSQNLDAFVVSVLMEVAQTLLNSAVELKKRGPFSRSASLDKWLNSPQLYSFQAGAGGASAGYSVENSTTAGFERSGFTKMVSDWLAELFPDNGGVICTIDNLELLQSSDKARQLLEQLRDELFNIKGLRWVLCGALGIVYGVADSPRLGQMMHDPIPVAGIEEGKASEIYTSRVAAYSTHGRGTPYLPLREVDFIDLYHILQGNLRNVLHYASLYCQWIAEQRHQPHNEVTRASEFQKWLSLQTKSVWEAVSKELRPRANFVFRKAIALGGIFSPGDHLSFGSKSVQSFRPPIKLLEQVNLVVSTQDESDRRRKTIQVTPKGWMVYHHMKTLDLELLEEDEDSPESEA